METLPEEIIERIICYESLSISDVVNFSLTNRYNNFIVTNCNRIWKKEYFKTWPQFVKIFQNEFNNDWYEEVRYIYDLKRRTREILSMMSSRFFKISSALSNSDFTEWFALYNEKPQTYYYLIDDLMNIIKTDVPIQSSEVVPIATPGNKTLQYYAKRALRYLRRLHLAKEWRTFIALPEKLQTLDKGIVFVGQWFEPNNLSWMNIGTELDELTEKVKQNLKIAHPNHPLFAVPKEELEMWRNENIECDKYGFLQSAQIKHAMADVMIYQLDQSYLFSNIVLTVITLLETAVPSEQIEAILLIIYETIGRRLGVKHEPIVDRTGLYLRYSGCNNPEEHEYIDFAKYFDGHRQMVSILNSSAMATTQQVIQLIAKQASEFPSDLIPSINGAKILCSRFEFLELVSPFDVSIKHDLARLYMTYNMDTTSYIEALMQQKDQAPEQIEPIINMLQQYESGSDHGGRLFRKVESKVRPTNLKYAVGMVMERPVNYSYSQLCVICDWDFSALDEEPFYTVLLPHGSYQYLPESELRLPRISSSSELLGWCYKNIGRHFSHRFETVFVPNAEKDMEYPADAAVRNKYNEQIKPLV